MATKNKKAAWFHHIAAITRKGYEAAQDPRLTIDDCPYEPSIYVKGVQQQRIRAWQRGFNRQRNGLPLCDYNG